MAFLLTAILIIFAAVISVTIIFVQRKTNKPINLQTEPVLEKQIPLVEENPSEKTAPPEVIIPAVPLKTTAPPLLPPAKPLAQPHVQPLAQPPIQPPQPVNKGTIVFIIDDAGNNLYELEPFLRFPGLLTIAVLPGLPNSTEAARRIRAAGKEVFLHQPMEAIGGQDPGPGALYSGMSSTEIRTILKQNLTEIGPAAGINNHQGSKITADRQIMETILAFCREEGIIFVDSKTSADTSAAVVAGQMGINIGERNIFIDNEQNRNSMSHSINEGLEIAANKGHSIMIGHTHSPELAPLLTEIYQGLVEQGYMFATTGQLINK